MVQSMAKINLIRNLDYLMHEKRVNATDLQGLIGVPQSTTSRILNGSTVNPSDKTLKKYANYFDVDIADLRYKDLTEGQDVTSNLKHELSSTSPSVIDLISNLKEMEANGDLTPQVISTVNSLLEVVKSSSASKKEFKDERTSLQIDVNKLADEVNKQDE